MPPPTFRIGKPSDSSCELPVHFWLEMRTRGISLMACRADGSGECCVCTLDSDNGALLVWNGVSPKLGLQLDSDRRIRVLSQ